MRFSKYNVYENVDKGLVIYNIRLGKYVNIFNEPDLSHVRQLLSLEELPCDDNIVKALYSNGYVVASGTDEYNQTKNEILGLLEENKKFICITLYVTDNCNFRCVYCPQEHKPSVFSDESWEGLYKYLEKNVVSKKLEKIVIDFFGGEPLLRSKQIVSFLTKMKNLQKKYPDLKTRYNMTTNGYLLTPELYDKLAELGLKDFQITLDGFAKIHNQTRPLADGGPTWDVIVKNLDYINTKDDDITIQFRSNISTINKDFTEDFVKWVSKRYTNKKFEISLQPVSKINDNVDKKYVQNLESFKPIIDIQKKSGRSFKDNVNFLDKLGMACRFAANYFTITTDAKIYKCEYTYFEEVYPVGYLSDDGDFIFNEDYPLWTKDLEIEDCPNCIIYPLCAARYCIKNNVNGYYNHDKCMEMQEGIIKSIRTNIQKGTLSKYIQK